jgi:hypothetical protein
MYNARLEILRAVLLEIYTLWAVKTTWLDQWLNDVSLRPQWHHPKGQSVLEKCLALQMRII